MSGGKEFEVDNIYYNVNGYEVTVEYRDQAACVLTLRHRQSGAIFTTVVSRKGSWPYVVVAVTNFCVQDRAA